MQSAMDDPIMKGHTWDGIHPQEPYLSHQGRRIQQRVYRLHRIATIAIAPRSLFFMLIHCRASLNPQLQRLLSAEGSSTTCHMVETKEWYNGLYIKCLHDELGTHATLELKGCHPNWTSEMMTGMPQVEETT